MSATLESRGRSDYRGASLVELMVALLLLSIASIGLIRSQIDAENRVVQAARAGEGAWLARDLAQLLRLAVTEQYAEAAHGPLWEQISGCDKPCHIDFFDSSALEAWRQQRLSSYPTAPVACIASRGRRVEVHLVWPASDGGPVESGCEHDALSPRVRLQTFLPDPGLDV